MVGGLVLLGVLATICTSAPVDEDHLVKMLANLTDKEQKIVHGALCLYCSHAKIMESIKKESCTLHDRIAKYHEDLQKIIDALPNDAKTFVNDYLAILFGMRGKTLNKERERSVILRGSEVFAKLSDTSRQVVRDKFPFTSKVFDENNPVVKTTLKEKTALFFELLPGGKEYWQGLSDIDKDIATQVQTYNGDKDEWKAYRNKSRQLAMDTLTKIEALGTKANIFLHHYKKVVMEMERELFQDKKRHSIAEIAEFNERIYVEYNNLSEEEKDSIKKPFPAMAAILKEDRFLSTLNKIVYSD